jgi:hypothetical protein
MGVLIKDGASSGVFRFVKMEWDDLKRLIQNYKAHSCIGNIFLWLTQFSEHYQN